MVQEPDLLAVTQIDWLTSLFSGYPAKIILAIIIILIGFILGKVLGRPVQRVLKEIELKEITKRLRFKFAPDIIIGGMITLAVYFLAIIAALNQLGLTKTVLYISAAVVLIIAMTSTFLGIWNFVPNALAGLRLKKLKLGQRLRMKGLDGRVKRIGVTETAIETEKGDTIYIPNATITKSFQED